MNLNENWTVYIVGQMHRYRITSAELAKRIGWTPAYLSTILNGRKKLKSDVSKYKVKTKILSTLRDMIREIMEGEDDGN